MIDVGVSDMAIYVPPLSFAHQDLADARGVPRDKYLVGLGNNRMSIMPNYEDAVTMAANAAIQVIESNRLDLEDIYQMVVSTESGVDHSKPVASFVQGLLKIGTRCRIYEIKHACYGGTAGIVHSIDLIARNCLSPKKALVITTDRAWYGFETGGEPTQGAGAVAMFMEREPKLFSIDSSLNGIYSKHVFDFWRPMGHAVPVVDGKYSIECYLAALEESISHFRSNLGLKKGKLLETLDYFVYHMPFTAMAKKAHRHLVEVEHPEMDPVQRERLYKESFAAKVEPSLSGAREVGNIYTGSVYMGLISLLENEKERIEDKKIGVFSYGSGCGAEFFLCHTKKNIGRIIDRFRFRDQLSLRKRVTYEEYVENYSLNRKEICHDPDEVLKHKTAFTRFVYIGLKDYKRRYC